MTGTFTVAKKHPSTWENVESLLPRLFLGQSEKEHDSPRVRMDIGAWAEASGSMTKGWPQLQITLLQSRGRARPAHSLMSWLAHGLRNAYDTSLLRGRDSNRSCRTILSGLQAVLGHTSLSLNSARVQAAASQLKSMKLHPPTPDLNWLYE